MSFNHIHHTYPHPSPTPGTAQAYLVPPVDSDADADTDLGLPTVDSIPTSCPSDFAVFPVASIPPGIQLSSRSSTSTSARRTRTGVAPKLTNNKRVVIAHAQSQLAVHAVRGLLKDAATANDGDESIEVYAMVHDTESHEAREIKALGATLLQYDPTSSSSIRSALGQSGASTLLLIPPQVDDTVIRTSAILTEARHSIKSILMWSTIGTDNAMDLPPEDDIDPQLAGSIKPARAVAAAADPRVPSALLLLKEAEELVTHVGGDIEFVVLRAGFPLQHFFLLSALIQNRGSIPFTSETAHMAPISLTDVGRATSILIHHTLTSGTLPDDYKNKTVLLTGPEPLSGPMIVTAANERLPHPLTFAKVGISDMRSFLLQTHASRFELSQAMGWWRLFMDGKLDTATGDLTDLVGGPDRVTKIRDFFEKHVDRFLPADGERFGAARYAHETYDEWDEVSSRGSSSESAGCSPSKLVSMVVRDAQQEQQHMQQQHAPRRATKSIAGKCISDTQHTYFPSRAGPSRTPSKSTKVVSETRPSSSPAPALTPDEFLALTSRIVGDFHTGLAQVMKATTDQLHALHAAAPRALASARAMAQVDVLIAQLGVMKDLVDACARDSRKIGESIAGVWEPEARPRMAAKVLGDVGGGNVCESCLRPAPARLVKKVVGDTGRDDSMAVVGLGAAKQQDQEGETVASKVGVFAKVMHDVADKEGQVGNQTQQGSCVIQ